MNYFRIIFFVVFISCSSKGYPQMHSDFYSVPDSIKAKWIEGIVFNNSRANKKISVTLTGIGKINDDVQALSNATGIPKSSFTTEVYFTIDGEVKEYSLPINGKTFNREFDKSTYAKVRNGEALKATLQITIYSLKKYDQIVYLCLIEDIEIIQH